MVPKTMETKVCTDIYFECNAIEMAQWNMNLDNEDMALDQDFTLVEPA